MDNITPPRFVLIENGRGGFSPCIYGFTFVKDKNDYYVCKKYKKTEMSLPGEIDTK